MIFAEITNLIVSFVVTSFIIFFLLIIFMASRYRKFRIDQFVIHLSNGKIFNEGIGGSLWLLPLIDDYIIIPLSINQTELKINIPLPYREHKRITIKVNFTWKVVDPQKCYNVLSWDIKDKNFAENILKKTAGALLRNVCDKMKHTQIIQERQSLDEMMHNLLQQKIVSWGIEVEIFEIYDAYISTKSEKTHFINVKV